MDVLRVFFLVILLISISACGNKKNANDVFQSPPEKPATQGACLDSAIKNRFIVKWRNGRISTVEAKDKKTFLKEFVQPQLDKIEMAEYDYEVKINDVIHSNKKSTFDNFKTYHINLVEANYAWDQQIYGDGITIAVIDTGADTQHPQLVNRLHTNNNEIPGNNVDDDNNGLIDDYQGYDFFNETGRVSDVTGHGTHVSGIAVADHSQGDVKGIAPKAKLLPLGFMGPNGSGRLGDAIKAIQYASAQGAKVINASWGGPNCSTALKDAIKQLREKDILFITASGNEGVNIDYYPAFPAAFLIDAQITVGASNERDRMAGYSNYSFNRTHLMAPGSNIYSTIPGGQTTTLSGTSMAAPIVTGTIALLWSRFPSATASQIKKAILESVDKNEFPPPVIANGRLNIKRALQTLEQYIATN